MPRWRALPSLLLLLLAVCVPDVAIARSAAGDRVLVVLEHTLAKSQYSSFWKSLEARGFQLTFKGPREEQAPLEEFGEKKFDHLIMFSPSAKSFSESLQPRSIVSSINDHNINTLFILSSDISEIQRAFAREFDVEFEERETALIDHFSYVAGSDDHNNVLLSPKESFPDDVPSTVVSPKVRTASSPILYNGIAHSLGVNPLLIPVLHASETGYSAEPAGSEDEDSDSKGKMKPILASKGASLVSALQTRGNARVGWIGSEAMLRDSAWKASGVDGNGKSFTTGNGDFIADFTKWVFQENGVLKVLSTKHHRALEVEPRNMYRIKDDLTYSITIAEHTSTSNDSTWSEFHASDIQLDFTMLDPHIRTLLHEEGPDGEGTKFSVTFKAPDRHGVFKFMVDYWRPGYTFIHESSTAPVVPFRHDEYPRFITGAWPFYSGALSVTAAFLLFCGLWLFTAEGPAVKAGKGKKAE